MTETFITNISTASLDALLDLLYEGRVKCYDKADKNHRNMKTFIILFKTISIPFSSTKLEDYKSGWITYIDDLNKRDILKAHSFFKESGITISGKEVEVKSYVPRSEIFSGYMIISACSSKDALETCKSCPVFLRNGELQIKELDESYLAL